MASSKFLVSNILFKSLLIGLLVNSNLSSAGLWETLGCARRQPAVRPVRGLVVSPDGQPAPVELPATPAATPTIRTVSHRSTTSATPVAPLAKTTETEPRPAQRVRWIVPKSLVTGTIATVASAAVVGSSALLTEQVFRRLSHHSYLWHDDGSFNLCAGAFSLAMGAWYAKDRKQRLDRFFDEVLAEAAAAELRR